VNPVLQSSIKAIIEQVVGELGLATKADVERIVREAIDDELSDDPAEPKTDKPAGRRAKQSDAERKAKRAAYQRKYRARVKDAATTEEPVKDAVRQVPTSSKPRKELNGVHTPPPIAMVPVVDLGEM
jgi:hypothetical protein